MDAYVLVPKSFMEFMFATMYRVTQKYFYARPYTSLWAPVVARQISKRYSSCCHVCVSCYKLNCFNDTLFQSARSRTFLLYTTSLINTHAKRKSNGVKSGDLGGQAVGPSACNSSRADKHVARV